MPGKTWREQRAEAVDEPAADPALLRHVQTVGLQSRLAALRHSRPLEDTDLRRLDALPTSSDMTVSTLARYAEGLGGRLRVTVEFEDGPVTLA